MYFYFLISLRGIFNNTKKDNHNRVVKAIFPNASFSIPHPLIIQAIIPNCVQQ